MLTDNSSEMASTSFKLNLPKDYDIPLAFTFANMTSETPNYRAHLYVNGWQYGKYGEPQIAKIHVVQ